MAERKLRGSWQQGSYTRYQADRCVAGTCFLKEKPLKFDPFLSRGLTLAQRAEPAVEVRTPRKVRIGTPVPSKHELAPSSSFETKK